MQISTIWTIGRKTRGGCPNAFWLGKPARFGSGVLSNDCSKSGKAPLCRTLTDHCRQDCGTRNSYVDFDYSDYRRDPGRLS